MSKHWLLIALLLGCGKREQAPVFKHLTPSHTGVRFTNTITTDDSVNVQNDVYIYNGAGVAVGDIDNDGLPDLFFSGNMVSSRLYLNRGGMQFDDINGSHWGDDEPLGDRGRPGRHQRRRLSGYLRLRLGIARVNRKRSRQSAVHQRQPHVHEAAARYLERLPFHAATQYPYGAGERYPTSGHTVIMYGGTTNVATSASPWS